MKCFEKKMTKYADDVVDTKQMHLYPEFLELDWFSWLQSNIYWVYQVKSPLWTFGFRKKNSRCFARIKKAECNIVSRLDVVICL